MTSSCHYGVPIRYIDSEEDIGRLVAYDIGGCVGEALAHRPFLDLPMSALKGRDVVTGHRYLHPLLIPYPCRLVGKGLDWSAVGR